MGRSFSHPALPHARGPLSAALFLRLRMGTDLPSSPVPTRDDPLADEDLQLALYCCYELHYRGFAVAGSSGSATGPDWEWDPQILRFRGQLEEQFASALRAVVPTPDVGPMDPAAELEAIIASGDGGPSLSGYMAERGTLRQMREFAVHRSLYQLKEADAHTWAIPRFAGRSRSALIEIQADEYGQGEPGQAHAELFADTMDALGLDTTYGAYLDAAGAETLATTNLISWFGLHRTMLPALLGHLALFEMTSVTPMGRYAQACDRLGLPESARRFYDVHVLADAHHGPLAARHLVGDFVAERPEDRCLVMWGARALMEVEGRFAAHLLDSWSAGRSSLVATPELAAA